MKALVVYDSVFGNTEKIARAIGDALGSAPDINVLRVGDVRPEHLTGLTLLIVGSPTRAFRPLPSISGFLRRLPVRALAGVGVAAFDTRIAPADVNSWFLTFMVKLFGYAAPPIADGLTRKGGELVATREGFFVKGTEGPLKPGELERAAQWAKQAWHRRASGPSKAGTI
jgi:flavodoxin